MKIEATVAAIMTTTNVRSVVPTGSIFDSPTVIVQVSDSAGLLAVVPQLLDSVHVLVCVPSTHADQSVQDQLSVQVGVVSCA